MERDKFLKEVLLNSAEAASADFTNTVMKKVGALSPTPLHYEPLVSAKIKRLFLFTFAASIALIVGLWLIVASANLHVVSMIQSIELPDVNYQRILIFIVIFWVVFA